MILVRNIAIIRYNCLKSPENLSQKILIILVAFISNEEMPRIGKRCQAFGGEHQARDAHPDPWAAVGKLMSAGDASMGGHRSLLFLLRGTANSSSHEIYYNCFFLPIDGGFWFFSFLADRMALWAFHNFAKVGLLKHVTSGTPRRKSNPFTPDSKGSARTQSKFRSPACSLSGESWEGLSWWQLGKCMLREIVRSCWLCHNVQTATFSKRITLIDFYLKWKR